MNPAIVHLGLNHLPVFGVPLALLLLLYGMLRGHREVVDASLVAFVGLALLAWPVFLSGPSTGRVVETIPGVMQQAVDAHAEAALAAMVAMQILGVVSLAVWLRHLEQRMAGWLGGIIVLVALVTVGLLVRVAILGTQIQHHEAAASLEIAPASASAVAPAPAPAPAKSGKPAKP